MDVSEYYSSVYIVTSPDDSVSRTYAGKVDVVLNRTGELFPVHEIKAELLLLGCIKKPAQIIIFQAGIFISEFFERCFCFMQLLKEITAFCIDALEKEKIRQYIYKRQSY